MSTILLQPGDTIYWKDQTGTMHPIIFDRVVGLGTRLWVSAAFLNGTPGLFRTSELYTTEKGQIRHERCS